MARTASLCATSGAVIVTDGYNQGFSITLASGFQIADVLVETVERVELPLKQLPMLVIASGNGLLRFLSLHHLPCI
ncbi:hypothetical protein ACFLU3_04465 [Chloroflexota bacterium]